MKEAYKKGNKAQKKQEKKKMKKLEENLQLMVNNLKCSKRNFYNILCKSEMQRQQQKRR